MSSWTKKIMSWLKAPSKGMGKMPWEVEMEAEEDFDVITAHSPAFPFKITIMVFEHIATLAIHTGITTDALDTADRMKIYKKALHMNTEYGLVKIGLFGEEDELVLLVDFDLASLSVEEFNDGLSALVAATYKLMEKLELEEAFLEALMEHIAQVTVSKIESGESRDDVVEFLMKKVGMKRKEAEEFVGYIMDYLSREKKKVKEKIGQYIG